MSAQVAPGIAPPYRARHHQSRQYGHYTDHFRPFAGSMRHPSVELYHLEIILGRAAIGAGPGIGHVFPTCASRDPFLGLTGSFVVNVTADNAHPLSQDDCLGGTLAHVGLLRIVDEWHILATHSPQ